MLKSICLLKENGTFLLNGSSFSELPFPYYLNKPFFFLCVFFNAFFIFVNLTRGKTIHIYFICLCLFSFQKSFSKTEAFFQWNVGLEMCLENGMSVTNKIGYCLWSEWNFISQRGSIYHHPFIHKVHSFQNYV